VGAPEVHHAEVWSTVWVLTTRVGRFWLKAGRAGDGGVEQVSSVLCRSRVIAPVAVDAERGWLLTRDGGTTMAAHIDNGAGLDPGVVCRMVADYATLQRQTVDHRHLFAEAGIAEVDPVHSAALAETHADTLARLPGSDPRHISIADHGHLKQAMPALASAARALAAVPFRWRSTTVTWPPATCSYLTMTAVTASSISATPAGPIRSSH
jgi:hypothetical protein